MRALPHVDPHARRGPVYRAFASVSATRLGVLLSRWILWKLDPHVLRLTGGRVGMTLVIPSALLETRGAKTGAVRRNGVIYFHDGDRVTLVASKLGMPENPSWFHNLCANPDVVFGGESFRAQVVEDDPERARLFALGDQVFPPYAIYRERAAAAGRTIPIVQLLPR